MERKGELPTLSFLIGVLIAILILAPLSIAFVKFMWTSSQKELCFDALVEAASGDGGAVDCSASPDYVYIAFDAVQQSIGGMGKSVERPEGHCPEGKACLCLYAKRKGVLQFIRSAQVKKGIDAEDLEVPECKELKGVKVVSGSPIDGEKFYEYGSDFYSAFSKEYASFDVRREGDAVAFCASKECGFDEPKKVLMEFKDAYSRCSSYLTDSCSCGSVDYSALGEDKITFSDSENGIEAVLERDVGISEAAGFRFFESRAKTVLPGTFCFLYEDVGSEGSFLESEAGLDLTVGGGKNLLYLLRDEGRICMSEHELYKAGCSAVKAPVEEEPEEVPL